MHGDIGLVERRAEEGGRAGGSCGLMPRSLPSKQKKPVSTIGEQGRPGRATGPDCAKKRLASDL